MTIDAIRQICRGFLDTTEDIKWVQDLVFSIGKKMYAVVNVEPPHTVAFKCTPETFAELVERNGIIPAPYLARAMWVRMDSPDALERRELEDLLRASYELVKAKLPKRFRLTAAAKAPAVRRSVPRRRKPNTTGSVARRRKPASVQKKKRAVSAKKKATKPRRR